MWWNRQKKKSPTTPRSRKIARLDRIFSQYIRRRDCGFAYGYCISCGRVIYYNKCDAGHYINRRHMATRYDEMNVNAQCIQCNRFTEGNIQGYRRGLIEKVGEKNVEMLEIKRFNSCKLTDAELDMLIDLFRKKLETLEKNQVFLQ